MPVTDPGLVPHVPGPLVLVGGGEWLGDATVDEYLVELAGPTVVVVPTAAAYERPDRAVETARRRYGDLGVAVQPCMILSRADASNPEMVAMIASARFVYLSGGSPLHLLSVLKDSPALDALREAWGAGAVIAGSSAGAMALGDPMVDPRGGGLTVGLGLVHDVAVVPHYTGEVGAMLRRTLDLAPQGCAVAAVAESTAVVCSPDGKWGIKGPGPVHIYVDGEIVGIEAFEEPPSDSQ